MIPQGTPARNGWWYVYKDSSSSGTQTPASATKAVASAMVSTPIPTDDTATCDKWAFHSTATGIPTYVGFGAAFLPDQTGATQMKTAYDVSQYDGITFNIKAGSSATPPTLVFEMLTKENQPTTSGGNLNASSAADMTVGLYNSRLQLLNTAAMNITTTWKRVYVPFATLIPRWVPAVGASMACASGNTPICQAPPFVPTDALAIQFSMYGAEPGFPVLGTAGTYDFWVDDVAFYKRSELTSGTSDLPALPSNTANHPFPQNASVGSNCTKPTGIAVDGKFLASAYSQWKANFVVSDSGGYKIIRPENGNDTVSEGIGYGMLIAVYMNDKSLFDGLYTYWKAHIASNGLMTWCIPSGGGSCSASGGTATDADEDAAFAMLMASKQWSGGTYAADATTLIHGVLAADMSGSYIKAGSNYSNSQITNPSYFAPAFYKAFAAADATNATAWNNLVTGSYTLLGAISTSSNGLVPAWCTGGSCSSPASNGGSNDMIYQYDSHRVPWRIGIDYCWNGTAAAKTYLDKNSGFFNSLYAGTASTSNGTGIGRIYDLYQLNGTPATSGAAPNSASIIGTAAVGAMHSSSYSAFVKDAYQAVFDMATRATLAPKDSSGHTPYSYFNATVGFLTLLTMSGNFTLLQ
jgi:endo-1,4-beta-D-glucanase Y